MSKPLVTHEQTTSNAWVVCLIVMPNFSDIIVVLSGDVSDTSFIIELVIFIKGLPRDMCDGLESRTNDIN